MAGLISPATIEQIRAASDIVEVIGSYLPLKRAGANFVALCPFHREKTPSFNVNPHRQIFHCFGCHKGGDVFTFVREYEHLSFVEAVRRLAQRANIPLEFDAHPGQKQTLALKETLWQIHDQIARRWQAALLNEAAGQPARDYLKHRGVSDDAVQLFRLGYAPDAWDDTVNWAKSKGYAPDLMEQCGLIIRKEGTDHYYDRFRGRLMFPICDEQSRVIAFSGRILAGDDKTAKYVNSPETPIFTKGRVFYGLDKSKRAILDAGCAVICEGQLDLIACYMAGVTNVVAPQGTAFTADHARILKRYTKEVVLCFDSDDAGQNAAVRALDPLLASGLAIRVALVPPPHDPDSFIKEHGGDAFRQLITGAESFFDFYLKRLCATHDPGTDAGRKAIVSAMREALAKTGDEVLRDTYAQKTAQRLAVSADAMRAEFRKGPPARHTSAAEAATGEPPAPRPLPPPSPHEQQLLKLLLATDDFVGLVAARLRLDWLTHPAVQRVVSRRLHLHAVGQWSGLAPFLDEFEDDAAVQSLLTEMLAHDRSVPHPEKQVLDVLLALRNQHLAQRLHALTLRLSHPETSEAERVELLRQQQELRQLRRQPL